MCVCTSMCLFKRTYDFAIMVRQHFTSLHIVAHFIRDDILSGMNMYLCCDRNFVMRTNKYVQLNCIRARSAHSFRGLCVILAKTEIAHIRSEKPRFAARFRFHFRFVHVVNPNLFGASSKNFKQLKQITRFYSTRSQFVCCPFGCNESRS